MRRERGGCGARSSDRVPRAGARGGATAIGRSAINTCLLLSSTIITMSDSGSPAPVLDVTRLLGVKPSSTTLSEFIATAASLTSKKDLTPEVKSYPDAVYFNYFALGLSLLFKPVDGYKPQIGLSIADLQLEDLVVDGVDLYNASKQPQNARKSKPSYSSYPVDTLELKLTPIPGKDRPASMVVKSPTTGKEFVECMGEPERKGGGAGPSSGSIGIWCEWSKDGVMVEFGGDESRGPQAWERGKDAIWKVLSVFPPKTDEKETDAAQHAS